MSSGNGSASSGAGTAAGYTDEEIMKTRLLIDGDGMGDDRKLNNLLKVLENYSFEMV